MIQLAAGLDGPAGLGFSTDLDLPAFPLNFDPQELLAEVDAGSDPQLNLQEMLELDIFGSPHTEEALHTNAVNNAQHGAAVHASKGLMTSPSTGSQHSHQQATPGVYELFQLQHVVPSSGRVQMTQWPSQQPAPQLQPAVDTQGNAAATQPWYQQPYQQQYQQLQPAMQQQPQYINSMQQPQQQFVYLAPNGLQQQPQQMLLDPQQANGFLLPQQAMYAAPNGSFIPAQQMYIPQQQLASDAPLTTTPFMVPAMYPVAPAGLTPVDQTLLPNGQLQPIIVPVAGPGSGSLSSPLGVAFHGSSGSARKGASAAAANGAAAAAGNGRKGRSKAAPAPGAPGMEKPKGPSRRFRERQKETISNLEAEVTEKLAQLQALSAENEMLKLRSAVLEATVKGREYHMRVIKEHGPPVFDAAEQRAADMLAQLHPQPDTESPGASQSGVSGCLGLRATYSDSDPEAAGTATDNDTATYGAAVLCHASSGVSNAANSSPQAPTAAPIAAIAGDACTDSLKCCDAPQMCSPAQQKKTINVLKHMSTEEIIRHWKQFLHDVTGELLAAEQEEQLAKLRKLAQNGRNDVDEDSTLTSAHQHVGKTCRWCSGCDDSVEHSEENCRAAAEKRAAEQQQQLLQQPKAASCAENANAGACCEPKPMADTAECGAGQQPSDCQSGQRCTVSEGRIVALVNKYSYMTKFVALLNPGVLYHLFGRHLDTGMPAPYTDDHWRQVVSRLGLSKHQVTVILACAELYFSSLTKLLDQRRVLQQQLKQADEGLSECQKRLRGVDGGINQLQVLDALASNLKREHVLRIMLNCFVWGRSLNSIQFAKSAVYSHPFFPDVHAMVCVLYEDARAMAPNGQPALVFPHRQQQQQSIKQEADAVAEQQQQQSDEQRQQQQSQLQALHEQLRAQSEELRLQALTARSGGSSSGLAF